MKRYFYIGAFMVLGLLLTAIFHALIEIPLLSIIIGQYAREEPGVLTRNWQTLHSIGGNLLWISGAILGLFFGCRFWRILYVEKRYGTPRW